MIAMVPASPMVLLAFGLLAAASPLDIFRSSRASEFPPTLTRRQITVSSGTPKTVASNANCSDPSTGRAPDCFTQLNLADYINNWVNTHQCYTGESFANCYLRQNSLGAFDCAAITANGCPAPQLSDITDAKAFYTAYNIFSVNSFFKTWYDAINDGSEIAEANVGDIASLISQNNAATIQTKLSSDLGKGVRQVRSTLNATSAQVLQNATEFIAFASQGNFSSRPIATEDASNYIYVALNTWLTASALTASNIYATVGRGTSVKDLASNGTTLAYPLNCTAYDSNNLCDAFYYSDSYKSSFGLVSLDTPQQNYGKVMSTLFSNYTTGRLLLENSLACNASTSSPAAAASASSSSSSVFNVTVTAQGLQTACIAPLPIQIWDMSCHSNPTAAGDENSNCEYLGRTKDPGFWILSKQNNSRLVPPAYLGPAIAQSPAAKTRLAISRDA